MEMIADNGTTIELTEPFELEYDVWDIDDFSVEAEQGSLKIDFEEIVKLVELMAKRAERYDVDVGKAVEEVEALKERLIREMVEGDSKGKIGTGKGG